MKVGDAVTVLRRTRWDAHLSAAGGNGDGSAVVRRSAYTADMAGVALSVAVLSVVVMVLLSAAGYYPAGGRVPQGLGS